MEIDDDLEPIHEVEDKEFDMDEDIMDEIDDM